MEKADPHRRERRAIERHNRHSITRLVKNGAVISATGRSFSSEVTVVMNLFLQFQHCQRSWTSRALTRSSHSRLTNPEPHRGHFRDVALKSMPCETSLVYPCAACAHLPGSEMIYIKDFIGGPSAETVARNPSADRWQHARLRR